MLHTNYKKYDEHFHKFSPKTFIPSHRTHCIRSKTAVLFGEYLRFL